MSEGFAEPKESWATGQFRPAGGLTKGMRLVQDFNEQFLARLADCSGTGKATLTLLGQAPFERLKDNQTALHRAAQSPYLLADFAFTDLERWTAWTQSRPTPRLLQLSGGSLPPPIALGLAREALTTAWVCCEPGPGHAALFFGMTPEIAANIRRLRLVDIERIAHAHAAHLRPRWETQPALWNRLLRSALDGSESQMHALRVHGLQLLAGERHLRLARDGQRAGASIEVGPPREIVTKVSGVSRLTTPRPDSPREPHAVVSSQARSIHPLPPGA